MTTKTSTNVQALYAHIHRLLDEHVSLHLTTYYVDCTQFRVYQALSGGLLPVPVDDPHSLVLPSNPLVDFIQEHCQNKPQDMCERLRAVKETQELIHHTIKATPPERIFTSKFPDTFCCYSQSTDIFTDPSVLAVHSIRHTPKPGYRKIPRLVPLDMREVLSHNSKDLASEEENEDIDARRKDVFHSRLALDNHTWKEILFSYQASPFSTMHTGPSGTESALCNKFLCRTPSPPPLDPLPQTPPLFPRVVVAPEQPAYVPASMSDLSFVASLINGDRNEGTPEYATISDEWAASSTLSPPTPYLNDGTSEQDEIFTPSSESQELIHDFPPAKMDVFYMPRQSCVAGSRGALKVPGQGQLLHEYIGRVIYMTREPNPTTTPSLASDTIVTPLTSVHRVGAFPTLNNMCRSSDDLEDAFLERLALDFADEAMDTVLFDQSVDTRSGLMDVPQLPVPNVHAHNAVWPNDMSSLITYKGSSAFYVAKGIKPLNFELTWRPYHSEQAIPTLEELVGVSELYNPFSVEGEAKAQLDGLLKGLDPLTYSISIEEENQGKLQAFLKSPTNLDLVTHDLSSLDCEISNVLLTRAERHRSRLPPRACLERDSELWGGCGRAAQSQSPERSKSSEDDYHKRSTDYVRLDSADSSPLVREHALLPDPPEDMTLDADNDIISAPHENFSMESIVSILPAGLSPNFASIRSLEGPNSSSPDWIHPSRTDGLEGYHVTAAPRLETCGEQSLPGYLNVLAKQPLLRGDIEMRLTPPARSEVQRPSSWPVDTEGLLHELSRVAAPLPPLEVSPHRNHRYLASVELLQDRPLMHALHSDSLRIELLEREWLDGADIVFDCDTALVFAPSFQTLLPSSFSSLKNKLSLLSWRYFHVAVVFKVYGLDVSGLHLPQNEEEQTNLFSRVIKSIKKLQRDLALAEAYATKRPQTIIQMYFVRSVEQAAVSARILGDMAESRSRLGPWGDRLWLEVDEKEEERHLTGVDGMNAFAAAVILSQISLHDFLALRADQRLQLDLPIPEGMIEQFNEVIARRREDVGTFVKDKDEGD